MGGRGAYSEEMGGGFNSAGPGGGGNGTLKYPAEFNVQGRFSSVQGAVDLFKEKYLDASIEYGISVDEQGFVHRHVQGNNTSVAISAMGNNHTIVHNHPISKGGNFSGADLSAFAQDKKIKTMMAIDKVKTYSITREKRFNEKGFIKAMKSAQWPKRLTYGEGADWWLKRNAKRYGYTYTRYNTK